MIKFRGISAKMEDTVLDELLSGDLHHLGPQPKRVVRLFISSTFTDMTLERNSLMERVYPRLKKYCRERYSLDFQVVDMRWGVRDEATDDHQTATLCSREIDNCQRMSLGPNFVALLGDKYGFRPVCNRIKSTEYRALRRCLIELDINTDFLDTWYREDLNAVPSEYILQPISSILKNFTNKKEPELQAVDQRIWQAIQERIHELLMIGSSRLVKQGRMDEQEQLMKYSISVTEREVIEGCLDVNEAHKHCLVYVRSIVDILSHWERCKASLSNQLNANESDDSRCPSPENRRDSQTRKASLKIGEDTISLTTSSAQSMAERKVEKSRILIGRYIDLYSKSSTWKLDHEAQQALANLKDVKLAAKFRQKPRNLTHFKVMWNERDGVSLKSEEHKHYVNDLTEHFYSSLVKMIRKASKYEGQNQSSKSGLVGEVSQHSHYAIQVTRMFHGRADELDQVRRYLVDGQRDLPMFIYGVSGSGKTSLIAKAVTLAKDWIKSARGTKQEHWNEKPCIITRFCCTTPSSSTTIGVLKSICRQLQYNFYQYGPMNGVLTDQQSQSSDHSKQQSIPDDLIRLAFTFRQLLDNCLDEYHKNRLFVIVLDAVEKLTSIGDTNVEIKYSWLTSISKLPSNVRLIVSCSSEGSSQSRADFRHLKSHFLQTYLDRMSRSGQSSMSTSGKERPRMMSSGLATVGERYSYLRRLIIPAVRLMMTLNQPHDNLASSSSSSSSASPIGGAMSGLDSVWILHVRPLGEDLAKEAIQIWLANIGRTLTEQQWSIVQKSLSKCSRPIFVKLAFGEVVNWKSYNMQSDSRGLTFGSAILERQSESDVLRMEEEDQKLRLLRQDFEDLDELDESLQVIQMEQQWINFIDLNQKQTTAETKGAETDLVIRVSSEALKAGGGGSRSNALSSAICHLSSTIDEAVYQLFARIELQHGYTLTKHSLSYITAARNGICENELEDILSLDDVVLDDVFQYHLPPVRRIPPLLWTRIRNDLPDYLSERDADGIVVDWHHGQFRNVTRQRYLADATQELYIHSTMADYFLGTWADKAKPFRCTKQQIQMAAEQFESAVQGVSGGRDSQTFGRNSASRSSLTNRLGHGSTSGRTGVSFSARNRLRSSDQHDHRLQWTQAKADRRVPQQPLFFQEENSDKQRYNLRKITELPYHLMKSRRFVELANVVLFNYDWLYAALQSTGLQNVLLDISETCSHLEAALEDDSNSLNTDGEIREELDPTFIRSMLTQLDILGNTIRLSCSSINADPQMLAPQLIGRLSGLVVSGEKKAEMKLIIQLLNQCDSLGHLHCALLPVDHCLQAPNGIQLSSLEGHSFGIMSIAMVRDSCHLLSVSTKFLMWDISTGEVSRDIDPQIGGAIIKSIELGESNEFAIGYTSDNVVLAVDVLTQQVAKFELLEEEILGIKLVEKFSATRFIVFSKDRWHMLHVVRTFQHSKNQNSIELEYSVELSRICPNSELLGVVVATFSQEDDNPTDLTLLEIKLGCKLQLITVQVACLSDGVKIDVWCQKISARAFAFNANLTYLVASNSSGCIYSSKRSDSRWASWDLLWQDSSRSGAIVPLAIELEMKSGELDSSRRSISKLKTADLADFERRIDSVEESQEMQDLRIFSDNCSEDTQNTNQFELFTVKLYYDDKIIVLQQDGNFKRLILPRNLCNLSVQLNRCQMKSLIMRQELLAASLARILLIFDINNESLLTTIDAHSARIVQIVRVDSDRSKGLCVASASLDRTVKIWNLENLRSSSKSIDKLNNAIEQMKLAPNGVPLVACLNRLECAIWNWTTQKIEARLESSDFSRDLTDEEHFFRCQFSSNGQRFALATKYCLYIFNLSSPKGSSLNLQRSFRKQHDQAVVIRRMKFLAQDSKIILIGELIDEHCSRSSSRTTPGSGDTSERQSLCKNLIIQCISTSDGTVIWSIVKPTQQIKGGNIRVPVLSKDQQNLVLFESMPQESHKTTQASRLQVYSAKDGSLVRSIDLTKLELAATTDFKSSSPRGAANIGDQSSRMKAIVYRERASVVALLNDATTDLASSSSYLVDINSRHLLASSSIWSGKLTADGRFGLSWMFNPSCSGAGISMSSGATKSASSKEDSLQVLEMRHLRPTKTLLRGQMLARIARNDSKPPTGNESDLLYGFSGSDGSYAFVYEARLKRLLLIRLDDARLIANYKLSVAGTKIKCAPSGNGLPTLLVALGDGSLTALAIVDAQKSDAMSQLAQLPSRRARC